MAYASKEKLLMGRLCWASILNKNLHALKVLNW